MSILGIDLGGTKLAAALFSEKGNILGEEIVSLEKRAGADVGELVVNQVRKFTEGQKGKDPVQSIGIAVPGISNRKTGSVWAPNIPAWEKYPLHDEVKAVSKNIPLTIEGDRACYMMGEYWKGAAQGCLDAVFLAVGTGIGAGILVNGEFLRGAQDIAGSIGWMAIERPFQEKYIQCGCFESSASGEGMVTLAKEFLSVRKNYKGILIDKSLHEITAYAVFQAYDQQDEIAKAVIAHCIESWGMAIATLVSLFNPEKIILGGGVFGPALQFIPLIRAEASRWAQPISMKQVAIEPSLLGIRAGLYGAAWWALQNLKGNHDRYI